MQNLEIATNTITLGAARDAAATWPLLCSCHRYDENPKCEFDATSLNVAIHVRMGDRRAYVDATAEYFRLLEAIMATVSQQVVEKGLEQPRFHVFSETLVPCPSVETGTFDEFPAWPVQPDQVSEIGSHEGAALEGTEIVPSLRDKPFLCE